MNKKERLLNIALDGPSGSGKSTVADIVAKRFSILHLDTGAMYRAVALKAVELNIDGEDKNQLNIMLENLDLQIMFEKGKQKTLLDKIDVSEDIRKPEVSMKASKISSYPEVRIKMVEMQREIAKKIPCILDGRDIGTCVLKDAPYKFFLTASPEIRAERRMKELLNKGFEVDYDSILQEIKQRDYNDSHREFSPLKKADGATEIDSSDISAEKVADIICEIVERGLKDE